MKKKKSDTFDTKEYNHRNSTYLSVSATIAKSNVNIINTVYFQP